MVQKRAGDNLLYNDSQEVVGFVDGDGDEVYIARTTDDGSLDVWNPGTSSWDQVVASGGWHGGQGSTGWKDMVSSITTAGVPAANAPALTAFGPSGLREEMLFDLNDYCFCPPFHVNHDIKVGGKAYVHVHWSTNGTQTATVKWELQISRALRATGVFGAPVSYYVEQAGAGVAWRHMVTEVGDADALTLTEPDELILVTLRRVTNGGTNNTNSVFALTVDFHYESNRDTTPLRAAPFY